MIFTGSALLAGCLFAGLFLGQLLGQVSGIQSDIGGVGIAMLLLIGSTHWLSGRGLWPETSVPGIRYWGDIYIPIVVAMAASQNVLGALAGGWLALVAGAGGVAVCFVCCRLLIRAASRGEAGVKAEGIE
jgi:malonate transporter MadL subunit